jgi:serine/threonine protein kinase
MDEEAAFASAVERKTPNERSAYLDEMCAGNPVLRCRIEALLLAHEESGDLLDAATTAPEASDGSSGSRAPDSTTDQPAPRPISEGAGSRIGPYKLLQQIGEGGMGVVFVAEQERPVRRKVALKVIKPGMDSAQVIARFEAERQALALMDHHHIAKVLDAGTTESGRPFFVMELVKGVPITEYCDINRLGPRERLELFVPVCQAIQHAHHKGIIHRDIKPSNVMVTFHDGKPVPKVIDFGVAKAIDQRLTERTLFTQLGQIVGTTEYMSPEQAQLGGLDIDTRSDIYALGVMLYELLTGSTPLERARLREAAMTEILRRIREEEPQKPSTRLSTTEQLASIAAQRNIEPGRLTRMVRGELDWIVMKALEKDRTRRYETANGLASDVARYLEGDPVHAGPPSVGYLLKKLARKHRSALATAAALPLLLLCAAAMFAAALIEGSRQREADARREAELNLGMAQDAVDDYLTIVSENTLLKEQDSVEIRNLRQELLQSVLKYYQHFVKQRSNDPRLRQELANAYSRLGEITYEIASPHQALEWLNSAQTIWERLAADQPKNHDIQGHLAACYLTIAKVHEAMGNLQGALKSLAQAHAILLPLSALLPGAYRARLAECYSKTGAIQARLESPDEALEALEKARAILQQLIERAPDENAYKQSLVEVINNLGYVYYKKREFPSALSAYQAVEAICQSLLDGIKFGGKPVWLLNRLAKTYYKMAMIHSAVNRHEEARRSYARSLDYQIALVDAHPSVTEYHENLGKSYLDFGTQLHGADQEEQALDYAHKSLNIFRELVRSHPDEGRYRSELALSWNLLGVLRDDQRQNLLAIQPFAHAVEDQKRAVEISKDVDGYKSDLGYHLENLGEQYVILGGYEEGLKYCLEALEGRTSLYKTHPNIRRYALEFAATRQKAGDIQLHAGDFTKAKDSYTQARELLERLAADAPEDKEFSGRLGTALTNEAVALAEQQKPEIALPLLERAVNILTPLGTSATADAQNRERLSEALWQSARVHVVLNQGTEARQAEARRKESWKGRPASELVTLALAETARAALTGYRNATVSGPARSILDRDLSLAADDLRLAISLGFADLAMLESRPEYRILLTRDEFKPLIEGLNHPGRNTQPKR